MDKMLLNPAGLGEPRLAPEHQQAEHPKFAANQKQLLWQQTATGSCGWFDGAGRSGAQSRCARQVTAAQASHNAAPVYHSRKKHLPYLCFPFPSALCHKCSDTTENSGLALKNKLTLQSEMQPQHPRGTDSRTTTPEHCSTFQADVTYAI